MRHRTHFETNRIQCDQADSSDLWTGCVCFCLNQQKIICEMYDTDVPMYTSSYSTLYVEPL